MRFNRYKYQPDPANVLGFPVAPYGPPVGIACLLSGYGGPFTLDNPPGQIIVDVTNLDGDGNPAEGHGTHVLTGPDYIIHFGTLSLWASGLEGSRESTVLPNGTIVREAVVGATFGTYAVSTFTRLQRCDGTVVQEASLQTPTSTRSINSITIV